jgi:hypothetical protein
MDDHMGVFNQEYITKMQGYDKVKSNLLGAERV